MSYRQKLLQTAFGAAEIVSAAEEKLDARPPEPNRILILTARTPNLDYGTISEDNKRRYAENHGYAFQSLTSGFLAERPPAWSKIRFIQRALAAYRWVFWTDADALVMNPAIRIESFMAAGCDIHLTRALTPFPHINTGHMLFRASAFTSLFLAATWRLTAFIHDSTWEQHAINHLLEHYRFRRVKISPNRLFNAFAHVPNDPDPYRPGDFIVHLPGVSHRTALLRDLARAAAPATAL